MPKRVTKHDDEKIMAGTVLPIVTDHPGTAERDNYRGFIYFLACIAYSISTSSDHQTIPEYLPGLLLRQAKPLNLLTGATRSGNFGTCTVASRGEHLFSCCLILRSWMVVVRFYASHCDVFTYDQYCLIAASIFLIRRMSLHLIRYILRGLHK